MPEQRQQNDRQYDATAPGAAFNAADQEQDFEALLRELQQVVDDLDGTTLSLEASIQAYERAAQLAAACQRILDAAELRVTTIDEEMRRVAEDTVPYSAGHFSNMDRARALLLGGDDEDDLSDLLDDDED